MKKVLSMAAFAFICAGAASHAQATNIKQDTLKELEKIQHQCTDTSCLQRVCRVQQIFSYLSEPQLEEAQKKMETAQLLVKTLFDHHDEIERACTFRKA